MKPRRWALICAMVAFALLLSGCINIQQEYWLNGDGSARLSMDVGMSDALLSMGGSGQTNPFDDLKQQYATTNPHIKNVQVNEYHKDNMQHFAVNFEVTNFEDFLKTQGAGDGEFNVTVSHQPDGSIQFKQLTQLNAGSQTQGLDAAGMGSMFKDMYWTVIVHTPQVVSSNGTKMDNGTVQWKIPMSDVFDGRAPSQLTLTYKASGGGAGVGGWIWLVLGLLVVLALGAAGYYFLVMRKRVPLAPYSGGPGYPPAGRPYVPGYPNAPVPPQGGYPAQPVAPVNPAPAMPPQAGTLPPWPEAMQPAAPQARIWPDTGAAQPPMTTPEAPTTPQEKKPLPPTKPLTPPPAAPKYPQYHFPKFPPPPAPGYGMPPKKKGEDGK